MIPELFEAVLCDLFGTLITERGDAIAGASDLLGRLPQDRSAIVTSCPASLAQALIERAQLPLPCVLVTSDDVDRDKPAPDCYLLAARQLRAQPERCLVLEDSGHGIAAAKAAGMIVINVRETALSDLALTCEPDGRLRLRG